MKLDSCRKAHDFFLKHLSSEVEEFWIVALNSGLEVIDKKLLFRGTADRCLVHPRDVIRFLCTLNATSYVVAHNHPSGDPRPSRSDVEITKRIFYLTQLLEIPMHDHIIISEKKFFSFAEAGLMVKFSQLKSLRLRP